VRRIKIRIKVPVGFSCMWLKQETGPGTLAAQGVSGFLTRNLTANGREQGSPGRVLGSPETLPVTGFWGFSPAQILTANPTANTDGELLKRGNARHRRGSQNVENKGFARPAASCGKNKQNKKPNPKRAGRRVMMNVKHPGPAFGAAGQSPGRTEGGESKK
jgi:hypothetical protein